MPTLRRTIYIGLGGAGIQSILETKKLYIETYGEVPPMIQFIAIDTCQDDLERHLDSKKGVVRFAMSERCMLAVQDAGSLYGATRENLSWFPTQNERYLLSESAGQVRTNGRFVFVFNVERVKMAVRRAFDAVRAFYGTPVYSVPEWDDWPLDIQINLVFSLAGGTGSGIFLDVAYLIRKLCGPDVMVNGYAILPTMYRDLMIPGLASINVMANGYAALQELDFLMHLHPEDEPVTFNWISDSFTEADFRRTPTPFDWVYWIGHVNSKGVKLDLMSSYKEAGLALFEASGQIGLQKSALLNCLNKPFQAGYFDIMNKKAWSAAVGASVITYNGSETARFYANSIAVQIMDQALRFPEGQDSSRLAIQSFEAMRLQDNQIIEILSYGNPGSSLVIQNLYDPNPEIDAYRRPIIQAARRYAENGYENELQQPNMASVYNDVVDRIMDSENGGIPLVLDYLRTLASQIGHFIQEIEREQGRLEEEKKQLEYKLQIAQTDFSQINNSSMRLFMKGRLRVIVGQIADLVTRHVANEMESIPLDYAVRLVRPLVQDITSKIDHFEQLSVMMQELASRLRETNDCQVESARRKTIEIDLITEISSRIASGNRHFPIGDVRPFLGEKGWYGIEKEADLESALVSFAESLPEYLHWKTMSVVNVFDSFSEEDAVRIIEKAQTIASPYLLIVDLKPIKYNLLLDKWLCIGMENNHSRHSMFESLFDWEKEMFRGAFRVETEMNNRISFFAFEGMIAPFTIDGIDSWQKEYELFCKLNNPHIDTHLCERMLREKYSLFPAPPEETQNNVTT